MHSGKHGRFFNMKNILEKSFKNKKVLITGHTGFKGSWLSIWLRELGADVTGYALDPYTENDNFVRTGLSEKIFDIRGDVRDIDKLSGVFKKYKPEIVFHLAAQPLVRESYINPKETFDINIGGTVNVFECCRESDSVRAIINVTSDKCYENIETERGYKKRTGWGGMTRIVPAKDAVSWSHHLIEGPSLTLQRSLLTGKHCHL